jgi:predicted MFS family arabinose efflux permease
MVARALRGLYRASQPQEMAMRPAPRARRNVRWPVKAAEAPVHPCEAAPPVRCCGGASAGTAFKMAQDNEFRRGWQTVLAAAFGACAGLTGLAFYTFGLFVKPLSHEFGWTRGQIGLGMTCITAGTVLCAPGVGLLTDRFGVRRVAAPSLVGLAVAYALLSRVGGPITTFYLACFGVALLGCATSPITWTRAVIARFQRHRGLALGVTMLGSALAGAVGGPLVQSVILSHGWQGGYLAMAAFALVIALPIVLLFLKGPTPVEIVALADDFGWTLRQAMGSAPFWMMSVGIFALITAQSGVIVHLVPLLTDRGVSPMAAAGMAGLMGLAIFFSRVIVGALLDRFNPPLVAGLVLVAPVGACILLAVGGADRTPLTAAILLLGLSAGAEIDFLSFFASRHFGAKSYGRIYGVLFAMFSLGNGAGAPLVGAVYDHFGRYQPALWIAAGLFALGAALFAGLAAFRPDPARTFV